MERTPIDILNRKAERLVQRIKKIADTHNVEIKTVGGVVYAKINGRTNQVFCEAYFLRELSGSDRRLYFRIQPAGLDVKGHYSTTSFGELADCLHVFEMPGDTFHLDSDIDEYGDEVVVIESGQSWPNDDVEGVCIDPEDAEIVARFSWSEWIALCKNVIARDWPEISDADEFDLQNVYNVSDWDGEIIDEIVHLYKRGENDA